MVAKFKPCILCFTNVWFHTMYKFDHTGIILRQSTIRHSIGRPSLPGDLFVSKLQDTISYSDILMFS